MSDLNFEPVINDIIRSAIENGDEKIKDYRCDVVKIDTKGGNFLGELYHINVDGNTEKGDSKTVHLFMKIAPKHEALRAMMLNKLTLVYQREIFVYNYFSKTINELQSDFNIPEKERYLIPRCFGAYEKEPYETLIMENLVYKGYKTYARMKPITLNYMNQVIKHLAKFHALSFIIQKYSPEFYLDEIKTKKEEFLTYMDKQGPTEQQKKYFEMILENIVDAVKEEHKVKIRNWCNSEEFQKVPRKVMKSATNVNVLCHSDYRTENIFVKFDKNGDVTEVMPIDYQLIHYGSPVNDILYLIYNTTHAELRRPHFESWLNVYHKSLTEFLKSFDIVAEDVYPKKTFKQDVIDNKIFGLFVAVRYLPVITIDPEEVTYSLEDMFREDSAFDPKKLTNDVFKDRIRGIVEEYVQEGYL